MSKVLKSGGTKEKWTWHSGGLDSNKLKKEISISNSSNFLYVISSLSSAPYKPKANPKSVVVTIK